MEHLSQYNKLNDEALLEAYRASGNKRLLGMLLQRYTMLLLGVAMKYLKDRDVAEDAVQQVFLKAITHLPQGEVKNFKGWLYILMRNHCLQLLRDKNYVAGEEALSKIAIHEADKEEMIQREHTLEHMEEALCELNEEQKMCITLFYLKKQSYNEIIAHTGFTFTQVKSYIQNGKRNLKILLMKKAGGNKQ
ncbi:MAG: hypothetical protein BGO69_04405 [Bacteroidetes bacterium 46-16]|nr:MAG: hypothetical protein BGO69_04405 [Bacteroidetes bacterium 46-16]